MSVQMKPFKLATAALCSASLLLLSCGPNPTASRPGAVTEPSATGASPPAGSSEDTELIHVDTAQLQPRSEALVTTIQETAQEIEIPLSESAEASATVAKIKVHEKTFIGGGQIEAQILSHPDLAAAIQLNTKDKPIQKGISVQLPLPQAYEGGQLIQAQKLNPETGAMEPAYVGSQNSFPLLGVVSDDGRSISFALEPSAGFQTQNSLSDFANDIMNITLAFAKDHFDNPEQAVKTIDNILKVSGQFELLDSKTVETIKLLQLTADPKKKIWDRLKVVKTANFGSELTRIQGSNMNTRAKEMASLCMVLPVIYKLPINGIDMVIPKKLLDQTCKSATGVINLLGEQGAAKFNPFAHSLTVDLSDSTFQNGFYANVQATLIESPYVPQLASGADTVHYPKALFLLEGQSSSQAVKACSYHVMRSWYTPWITDTKCSAVWGNPDDKNRPVDSRESAEYSKSIARAGTYEITISPLTEASLREIQEQEEREKQAEQKHPEVKALIPKTDPIRFLVHFDHNQINPVFKVSDYRLISSDKLAPIQDILGDLSYDVSLSVINQSGSDSLNRGEYLNLEFRANRPLEAGRYELRLGNSEHSYKQISDGSSSIKFSIGTTNYKPGSHYHNAELFDLSLSSAAYRPTTGQVGSRVSNSLPIRFRVLGPEEQQQQNTSSGGGGGGGGGGSSSGSSSGNNTTAPPANRAPSTPTCSSCPSYALAGQNLSFTFGLSDPDSNNSLSAEIDWGDGQSETKSRTGNGPVTASHSYSSPGSYTVKITAKDGAGLSSSERSHSVTIDTTHNNVDLTIE